MVNEIFKVNRSLLNFLVSTGIEINPFQPVVAFHIETSHLICAANQMIGFYMELKWVDYSREMFVFEFLLRASGQENPFLSVFSNSLMTLTRLSIWLK